MLMSSTTTTVHVIGLSCMSCGRGSELTVAAMVDLPRLPVACEHCAGSVLAVGSSTRVVVRDEGRLNWHEGLPKRGRPVESRSLAIPLPRPRVSTNDRFDLAPGDVLV